MKKSIFARLAALCLVALLLSGCQQATFSGSSIANPDEFYLEYGVLNMTRTADMTLEAGDSVRVAINAEGGHLDILVFPADDPDSPVYRANGAESGEFSLNIERGGVYRFTVAGKDAKGSVRFSVQH